ncbi:hypothetical protein [Streptomyces sp. NPDC051576]|uniref:hypothetical protein n=1 Tax=Streptomyces sp. NPDC051576 TaxID=3155803 RepID=UPI0034497793
MGMTGVVRRYGRVLGGAVLVAAATALATAMVGVWITPDNGPAPSTPESRPSAESSATPGP